MKNVVWLLLLLPTALFAQVPELFNYQAVARNAQGVALASQTINVRLSLQRVTGGGSISTFYTETRSVTTNALGLFNVQVGSGGASSSSGSISNTSWLDASLTHNLKVELDANNTNSFTDMGSQQLVSVPYALGAKEAVSAQTAVRISTPFAGFFSSRANALVLSGGAGTTWPLIFDIETFDSSAVHDAATGFFTAPEDGMYFLNYHVTLLASGAGASENAGIYLKSATRGILVNGNFGNRQLIQNGYNVLEASQVFFLSKNEKINTELVSITKSGTWTFYDNSSYFQAYRIR